MPISSLLSPNRIFYRFAGGSKKRTLEQISESISTSLNVDAEALFSALVGREKLGSTGIGDGVAIPHCRLGEINQAVGALVLLDEPIQFDAIDDQPVDLLFFLVVPEDKCDEHLETLAKLAEVFSQEELRDKMRSANSAVELQQKVEQAFAL